MMNNQNTNITQVKKLILDEELVDQSFEQINDDISKVLLEMKEENQESDINESFISEKSFSFIPKIKNNEQNENNIINQNIFNHFNNFDDYKSNGNIFNGNIFPNNQLYINNNINNSINNNINNKILLTNLNNNKYNGQNIRGNNYPVNNFILNSPIYNIQIINYNNNNKDNNNNLNNNNNDFNNNNNFNNNNLNNNNKENNNKENNKKSNINKFVSYRGVPGLYNSDFSKNIINLENILQFKDNRTTLIVRNIPNKYDIPLFLKELGNNFENKFDVIYLPFDNKNNSNLGFGFINFVNPIHIILFFEEFMGKKWNFSNSQKRCCLVYSNYQGKKDLVEYIFKKLGIKDLSNNNINNKIKKSFFINNIKNLKAPIEIPLKFLGYFAKKYPLCLCHKKDDKVFIFDI